MAAFQRRNGLKADGIAGKLTLNKLNSSSALPASTASQTPAAAQAAASTAFKAPSASEVRNANWYSEIRSRAKLMPDVVIYDPDTGLHFNLHMFSFGKHADAEPPTAADTAVLNRICGVNSWTPHYVWVIFTDGRVYIGSIHSHGHSVDHTSGNNLEGHICLHFPRVMTEAEATGPYAVSHQKEILFGWEMTQAMARSSGIPKKEDAGRGPLPLFFERNANYLRKTLAFRPGACYNTSCGSWAAPHESELAGQKR